MFPIFSHINSTMVPKRSLTPESSSNSQRTRKSIDLDVKEKVIRHVCIVAQYGRLAYDFALVKSNEINVSHCILLIPIRNI